MNEKHDDLWQRPRKKVRNEDLVWYEDAPVGRDTINDVMKNISEGARLSYLYTNHSIRATSITTLDSNDIAARHIQAVSGHKSEATIRTNAKYCPPKKTKQMFDLLTMTMHIRHRNESN